MDEIKEAFDHIREELSSLNEEMLSLREEFNFLQEGFINLGRAVISINNKIAFLSMTKTEMQKTEAEKALLQTENNLFKPQKDQNMGISKGNEGVQTDRQTDRQTDQQGENTLFKGEKTPVDSFKTASELIDSLDSIKKEIRLKFKRLTDQEVVVFSTIYQLEEEKGFCDYRTLSARLNISESSIRDYVRRLLLKGIPLDKSKVNNKEVHLSISPNLKKLAPLSTILKLIDL